MLRAEEILTELVKQEKSIDVEKAEDSTKILRERIKLLSYELTGNSIDRALSLTTILRLSEELKDLEAFCQAANIYKTMQERSEKTSELIRTFD
jgi:hypothetical protein